MPLRPLLTQSLLPRLCWWPGDNRTGCPRHESDVFWQIIYLDPHRDPLGEPNPVEYGVDIGQEFAPGGIVMIGNTARHAFDVPLQGGGIAKKLNFDWIAQMQQAEFGLFKIAVDPKRILIDYRQFCRPGRCKVSVMNVEVGNVSVNRGTYLGPIEVQLCCVNRHYIHPYFDGNGRLGRFLMNAMLTSGGYPWTVIRIEQRSDYMACLESASSRGEIKPFAEFVAKSMKV